jgi:hypothetical protein
LTQRKRSTAGTAWLRFVGVHRLGATILTVLGCAACGGRSGLDLFGGGGGSAGDDASGGGVSVDASVLDAVASVDATKDRGIVETDASCTAPMVVVGYCGMTSTPQENCCKVDVAWTCGDQSYRAGGGCGPEGPGAPPWTYQGVCDVNGQQTSTFSGTTADCACEDAGALAALAQSQCGPTVRQ